MSLNMGCDELDLDGDGCGGENEDILVRSHKL